MGGCQDYGFLLGPLNARRRATLRTQLGSIILTTTHVFYSRFTLVSERVYVGFIVRLLGVSE